MLNDSDISGAKWILLNITSSAGEHEHTMDEAEAIQAYVQQKAGDTCDVILGMGHDPNLKDRISVTVIATGFNHKEITVDFSTKVKAPEKIVVTLGEKNPSFDIKANEDNSQPYLQQPSHLNPIMVEPQAWRNPAPPPPPMPEQRPVEPFLTEMRLHIEEDNTPEPPKVNNQPGQFTYSEERKAEEPAMKITIREEAPKAEPAPFKYGRTLTPEEIEEQRIFEEQKKRLEEKAERLRRLSYNFKAAEGKDELETVPAYLRKNKKLDNQTPSKDNYYSGYAIGPNNDPNGPIQTINTFLDGNIVD